MTDFHGLSRLSDEVYKLEDRAIVPGYDEIDGAFTTYDSGFKASTYFNASENTLVITYSGTDTNLTQDAEDFYRDNFRLMKGQKPEQADEAISYANAMIEAFRENNPGNSDFNIVYTMLQN